MNHAETAVKKTRNPSKYLIEKLKESGSEVIVPNGSVRFLKAHLNALPDYWQGLDRNGLLKQFREMCEQSASIGVLKRKRMEGISGYVYEIL